MFLRLALLSCLLAAGCGQAPTESRPVERGTALPPPGIAAPR